MKHLKSYKIFEDYGIKQEIGDLIANLTDDGYHTTITERETNGYDFLIITIDKRIQSNKSYIPPEDLMPFPWIEVRPEIQRMVEYLKDRYFLHQTKLYKATWNRSGRSGRADREMFSFDYVIPMVGTDNLSIRNVEMVFIKEEINESSDESKWFSNITETLEDILLDLSDMGFRTMVDVIVNPPYPRTTGNTKHMIVVDISPLIGEDFIKTEDQYIELKNALLRIRDYINSNHSEWKLNDSPPADTVPIVSGIYGLLDMENDRAIRRLNIACGQMQLLGVDVPIIKLKLERK